MATTNEVDGILDQLVVLATSRHPDDPVIGEYLERYLNEVPGDDLVTGRAHQMLESAWAHLELGRVRRPDEVLVRAQRLTAEDGSSSQRALMFVTDDQPFLVDTVRLVLDRHRLGIGLLVYPMLPVLRDDGHRLVGFDDTTGVHEAWVQIQLDDCTEHQLRDVEQDVRSAIADVVRVVNDFPAMRDRLTSCQGDSELLAWLADRHYVFLGAASYDRVVGAAGIPELTLRPGTELGEYRTEAAFDALNPGLPSKPGDERVVIARSHSVAKIHRAARMTSLAVRDDGGAIEHRFFGLLSSSAYRESVFAIPELGERAGQVLALSGSSELSHTGRAIKNVVETLPRDLVFELDQHALAGLVIDIVGLQERRIVRVFDVAEPVGGWTTILVYIPSARFESETSDRVAACIAQRTGNEVRDVGSLVDSSSLARISMTVCAAVDIDNDLDGLVADIDALTSSWDEQARDALRIAEGSMTGDATFDRIRLAIPAEYRARVSPASAAPDLQRIVALLDETNPGDEGLLTTFVPEDDGWRFLVFRRGSALTIAQLVAHLDRLGLQAIDQRPYEFVSSTGTVHLYDVGVALNPAIDPTGDAVLSDFPNLGEVRRAFRALVSGAVESDGLNRLVLGAEITVRQVAVLRTYSRYLQQSGFPFSQSYIEEVLVRHAAISHGLTALFDARFDPRGEPSPAESPVVANATRADVLGRLDAVPSLDDDRICRAILTLIDATTRTNAFQLGADGRPKDEIAVKFDAQQISFLPEPRPMFEIFVCSPKVEGVHLRAGLVARGGLRWSDRREDYRTEVLGLVKAQMVKNAVIVPVGAKGGFVVKQPTATPSDRDAVRAEGVDRYQRFIRSLLDVTDNLVTRRGRSIVEHPADTVIYDADDPYLVVAADKGTATFSDIANALAEEYGFWLGDAFASGGSHGYDHKAMGITARGAWESVRRHARVLGKDVETDVLTAVGVGDMSGDVFGNGMLRSQHLRLLAAFDHRDVFLDPSPSTARAYAERRRLFELPRSSWADYDDDLISAGGGVYSRSSKSIPISDEVRLMLGLDAGITEMTPNEVLSSILRAPVDLLWNGGIGTYVKSSTESNESVGDRANDAIRVDGGELRCQIVGEGGNLGFTQLGRVEYAIGGGLIYTDAIDNSAGVDCSDHEVNIKIALQQLVSDEIMSTDERDELLVEMTDEVATLVLDDNRAQTLALMIARTQSLSLVNVHARYLDTLEAGGHIDRQLEDLPNDKQIAERQSAGSGLRAPELAVMIASTKIADIEEVMGTDLPDDPILEADLFAYFPSALRDRYPDAVRGHRLRREIIATGLVNNMVNLSGISFGHRMTEQSGASVADVARAFLASRNIVGYRELWSEVEAMGSSVDLDVQIDMFLDVRRMAERATSWMLRRRSAPLDIGSAVAAFASGYAALAEHFDEVVSGRVENEIDELREQRIAAGVPANLAARSARCSWLHSSFDIIEVASELQCDLTETAVTYWSVFDAFEIGWLWDGIGNLPRSDRWQTQARASLRDDLMTVLSDLTANVVRSADGSPQAWIKANQAVVDRVIEMVTEIRRAEAFDLTTLSVALRQLRNLTVTATSR